MNTLVERHQTMPSRPVAEGKPRLGRTSRRQSKRSAISSIGGLDRNLAVGSFDLNSPTINASTQCDYPYWHMMLWGHEPVYRIIRAIPTAALARYIVLGPIRASLFNYKAPTRDDNAPPTKWLKDVILPLRRKWFEALRAYDYGWQPFVTPWRIEDGVYKPDLRPVLPDTTTVYQSVDGEFAGIRNQGADGEPRDFNNLESWAPTLDAEAGYAYGRSRYENIRETAVPEWFEVITRLKRLRAKVSDIIPMISHPPGTYHDDDTGEDINFAEAADSMLANLPLGVGVRTETALTVEQLLGNPEFAAKLAELDLFRIKLLDAGTSTQGIAGLIQNLEYLDKLIFRGSLRPERAGLEAVQAGSRADSEQHTETGAGDSEDIDGELTSSFNEVVVKPGLRMNFGDAAAEAYGVISSPLLKWKQQVFRELLTRLVSIPELAHDVAGALDMDDMIDQMNLPRLKAFVLSALQEKKAELPAGKNGKPPTDKAISTMAQQLAEALKVGDGRAL
jgi:hypothetical protein